MSNLDTYLDKRGITEEQMAEAFDQTQATINAYNLKQVRIACGMTQVELAKKMGVSQNRVSRMENGEMGVMSLNSLKRYIEAVGGSMFIVVDLPTGRVSLG